MHGKNGMLYPLMVIAAVAAILVSMVGIATMTGHMPSAFSQRSDHVQLDAAPTEAQPSGQQLPKNQPVTNAVAPNVSEQRPIPAQRSGTTIARQDPVSACSNCGVVESVTTQEIKGQGSGLGAIAGGVLGGVLGHQIGSGRGRDVATVAGAVGGGFAGNEIEKNVKKSVRYVIRVRMEDGSTRVVTQSAAPAVGAGQRVRIEGGAVVASS